jgi:hypothetical protein
MDFWPVRNDGFKAHETTGFSAAFLEKKKRAVTPGAQLLVVDFYL